MKKLLALVLVTALPAVASAEPGTVDWQRRVVKCTGTGAPNLRDAGGNVAVARIGAERAAKLDALRNCMETLKGVNIKTGETVGKALAGDSGLRATVEGVVKGFKVVGAPRYFSDGGVEMDVEVPLDGKLADALMPKPDAQLAALPPPPPPGAPTGLIVDARGQKVVPALAPRILDEKGKEVYGPGQLVADARTQNGAAAYTRDVEAAKKELAPRVGDKPVVVKAVKADGADVTLANGDADTLRKPAPRYLSEGRVVIVTD